MANGQSVRATLKIKYGTKKGKELWNSALNKLVQENEKKDLKHKFSLIMCSYDPHEEWLAQAIESAKGIFDEYILVDDGSEKPISCPDNYILLRQENKGLWMARNLGISKATGDIICLLDDDDWLDPIVVKKMQEFVDENYDKADIFTHDYYSHELSNGTISIIKAGHNIDKILDTNQFIGTTWYKKSVWNVLNGYTEAIAEDWDFWIRAIKKELKIIEFDGLFYHYRKRNGSVSFDWIGEKFELIKKDIIDRHKV